MAMGRASAPMAFARPQIRPQAFAPRPAVFSRPRSFAPARPAFVPRQRGFFITTGHPKGKPFIFTPGFSRFGHHFRNRSFFFALPYSYGAYWPSYYDDSWNPYSFGSYSYDPTANTSSYTDLSNQMSQLSSEVEQLRDENDSLRSSLYQRRPPAAAAGTASGNEPPTVLVYRDGHRSEIQNYAIVGSTLWSLSPNRAARIPLAELDINQTIRLNEDRGISFQVPK